MPSQDGPFILSSSAYRRESALDDGRNMFFNPFADHQPESKPFTSALDSTISRASTPRRRRGSEGQLSPKLIEEHIHSSHYRSRTLDYGGQHPLRGESTVGSSSSAGRQDTRPGLARAVSAWDSLLSSGAVSKRDKGRADPSNAWDEEEEQQKVVLVHEVRLSRSHCNCLPLIYHLSTPTFFCYQVQYHDSLAGVALKYGIALAELRRANQLWASDSIHLRKVLYIPVEKARHVKYVLEDATADGPQPASTEMLQLHTDPDGNSDSASKGTSRTFSHYTIRRIPAARLSFFPPSRSHFASSVNSPSRPHLSRTASLDSSRAFPLESSSRSSTMGSALRHSLTTSSTPTSTPPLRPHALSTFVSALPFSASTRDEIFSRLSIESASTSTTGSDEQEHELAVVPTTPRPRPKRNPPTPFAASPRKNGRTSPYAPEQIALVPSTGAVRSIQMEPVPAMQLPARISRSSSASKAGQESGLVRRDVGW
ncbi:hypothetical protein EW146_g2280 [Bondarzewia mesenterica]|uniref:LysM domain-containing protein n=1 Tax=Bondarzewia mesenterica TaxID=1095465 RepID=A0A4S4M160_9AGAM|nr:hypothetical protein EW146_g2280 [Bondarzewia mesenterica]